MSACEPHCLLIGTTKGLVIYEKKIATWSVCAVHFEGLPVSMVFVDPRTCYWWAGLAHRHWGQKLYRSKDQGRDWEQVTTPQYPGNVEVYTGKKAVLKQIWTMASAGDDRPDELWMGTEPGGLFHSDNGGDSFSLVKSLWEHPSRKDPLQWFGAGKDYPFLHSIVVHPEDSYIVYVAVSCAGIFKTTDGGRSWESQNKGLIATYLPNPHVKVGHDPHLLLICRSNPHVLWQQNHCGIFRTVDNGMNWKNVSDTRGIAVYGFGLAIDDQNPDCAWVIPAQGDTHRIPHDLALSVYYTEDGGRSWHELRNGLPQQNCFDIVFRHAFVKTGNTLAFGTTNGNIYLSEDRGLHWKLLSTHMARVNTIVLI